MDPFVTGETVGDEAWGCGLLVVLERRQGLGPS